MTPSVRSRKPWSRRSCPVSTAKERERLTDLLIEVKRRLQEMAEENDLIEPARLEVERCLGSAQQRRLRSARAKKVSPAGQRRLNRQRPNLRKESNRFARVLLRIFLLIVVPAMVVAAAGFYWLQGARYVSTENAYVKTDIAKLAAEVSGKAVEVRAHAHMQVKTGDVLVKVDPRPFEIALSRGRRPSSTPPVNRWKRLRATLSEAHQELEEAQDRAAYYRKRYDRQKTLAKRGIIAETRGDELENDANAATDRVDMARQKIQRIMASLGGVPSRPVDEHPLVRAKDRRGREGESSISNERRSRRRRSGTVVTVPLVPGEQINAVGTAVRDRHRHRRPGSMPTSRKPI